MTTFRNGDLVSVSGQIVGRPLDFDGEMKVRVRIDPYHEIWVPTSIVTMARPKFEVGDRVEWRISGHEWCGHVLSIANEQLWIDRGDGNYATVWTGLATRLDPDPEPDADQPSPIPDLEPRVPRFDDGEDRSGEAE
jgi:hypothetical protein